MNKTLISIVVPVYTEEENIRPFYDEVRKATDSRDYDIEIVFVNDGSTDNTLSVLNEVVQEDARVTVVNFSKNFGSYAAIEAGFKQAKGDAVMAISVDLQDPPSIINDFVAKWREGHQIVWGVREARHDPFFKNLFAYVFYWGVRKFIFPDFPKKGMDIGLFDKKIIQYYIETKDRHSIPFFTIYAMGFNQAQVPYVRAERLRGESGWPFWKRVKCAFDIFVNFSYVPIRASIAAGVGLAFLSFIAAAILIFFRLTGYAAAPGWSSLTVIILFVGGIQLVFLGVIAEYIWRMSDGVKHKPNYYIMNVLKNDHSL